MWRSTKVAVLTGLLFGAGVSIFLAPLLLLDGSINIWRYLSIGSGVASGCTLGWFSFVAAKRLHSQIALHEGELLIYQGPANHFVGKEAAGGWLYLTNQRLLFASHGVNFFVHEWEAPLGEIRSVSTCTTLKVVPNGILVATSQGDRKFVVDGRRSWKEQIENSISRFLPAG